MPTYNNAPKLESVLNGLVEVFEFLIVVNDGSIDKTEEILNSFSGFSVVNHKINMGKGKALQTGFRHAIESGYQYAITIDSDGQHFPDDMGNFLSLLPEQEPVLAIGARNMNQAGVPGKSSFGNRFSNFWFWAETGIKMPDTQSGYRMYPLEPIKGMRFFTRKFEFEIEIIVRLAWKGVKVVPVPIKVLYEADRISHFRPFKDFTRISILNSVLVLLAILWMHPKMYVQHIRKIGFKKYLAQMTIETPDTNLKLSISAAIGVFVGIVPIWGYQLMTAIGLAYILKLNKPLVILAANISIPPFTPIILYLSFVTGALIYGGSPWVNISEMSIQTVTHEAMQYLVGAVVFSIAAAILTFVLSFFLLRKFRPQS